MVEDKTKSCGWLYSETVKDHFFNPRNLMKEDEKKYNADGVGYVGNPACGDMMKLWIKVDKKADKIIDCKWKTFGCASAIGSTSMLSEMVTRNGGMTIDEALKIKPKDILEELGGLPTHKVHCSVLGDKALRAAINDYLKKTGQLARIKEEEARVICKCQNVTDKDIEEAVKDGVKTFKELQERTKCSTACGQCELEIRHILGNLQDK